MQDLLKLKQRLYSHGKENIKVGADVSITVKISFYRYSFDASFKNFTATGISLVLQCSRL
jgi:hypothetical protein